MRPSLSELLDKALTARLPLFDARYETAFRLFNGFSEGCPDIVVDLYGRTVIVNNYADPASKGIPLIKETKEFLIDHLLWLRAAILKSRNGKSTTEKRGTILFGSEPDRKIKEHGVWYAIDLTMNRDASLYLDTRILRRWALDHLRDKTVLNAFAYTGSLGVAAQAGGARRVVQLDRNRQFLNLGKASYTLNGFPINKEDFWAGDFWAQVSRMKRAGTRFDCVFIDPPFFATSPRGTVDQVKHSERLINKVRPLINDGGFLVAINNALYVSGQEYMQKMESLCADGYLKIVELIPVPDDFTGYPETVVGAPITDPSPFNHSTKIAVLEVRRKQK